MPNITTILGTDIISTSRTTINTNFTNLDNNKLETSLLTTDDSFTSASDSKIPSQLAVKKYADAVSSPTGKSWNEYAVDAVGTDSYAITITGFASYVAGQTFKFKAGTANTGACSLNVNGLGAKTIKKDVSSDLVTGDILANQIVTVIYDGTNMQLQLGMAGIAKLSDIPSVVKFIGTGNSSNTTYENYKFYFGMATGQGWTSISTPTYYYEKIVTGSAQGVYKTLLSLDTIALMDFDNTKNKILEWDAIVQADATTGESMMAFTAINSAANISAQDASFPNRHIIGFITSANGSWSIATANGTTNTRTAISTPSVGKHTFRMEINPLTPSVLFYIDGVLVGTHTTNIPVAAASNMYLTMGNGTSSVLIQALSAPSFAIQK